MKGKLSMNSLVLNRVMTLAIVLLIALSLLGTDEIITLLRSTSTKLTGLKAQGQALVQEEAYLSSAQREIKKYSTLGQIAESIVPQDKGQAQTVREIVSIAQQNSIVLSGITFPSSTLGTQGGAAPASGALALSQLTPVKGIAGVYVLPIQVINSGSNNAVNYSDFYTFLTDLEQNRRTSLITGLSIVPLQNGQVNFSLTINEYIKPQ